MPCHRFLFEILMKSMYLICLISNLRELALLTSVSPNYLRVCVCRVALGCNRASDRGGGGRLIHAESLSPNFAIYYSGGAERWTPFFHFCQTKLSFFLVAFVCLPKWLKNTKKHTCVLLLSTLVRF